MFDTIKVENDKLNSELDAYEFKDHFQTKDLNNLLEMYTLNNDGRLIHHKVRYEEVPEEERPYYGRADKKHLNWIGSIKSIPDGDEDVNYHGVLYFYSYTNDNVFVEVHAKFTDGTLDDFWITEK